MGAACEYHEERLDEFVTLVGTFLSVSRDQARQALHAELAAPGSGVAAAWEAARPSTPEGIRRFYEETDSYIYALAADHCHVSRDSVWQTVIARIEELGSQLRVLVYGDGIGSDSLALAARGHRVTYFDVPGRTSAFAQFRFRRSTFRERIEVVLDAGSIAVGSYDAVVCIEVLEHLPDPVRVMRDLVHHVRTGGRILVTESFGSVGEEFPSHLPANAVYAGRTPRIMEGFGAANTFYSTDPVNYPMEFTRARPGLPGLLQIWDYRGRRILESRLRSLRRRWSEWRTPGD